MRLHHGLEPTSTRSWIVLATTIGMLILLIAGRWAYAAEPPSREMPRIGVSDDGAGFVLAETDRPFVPWGFNYLGQFNKLAEDDWDTEAGWRRIEKDFHEMRQLGANVVRWHLQFETFMKTADQPDVEQLARLKRLLELARSTGLYLNLTGLNCFRIERIPPWYDELSESDRWKAQAVFWAAVARTCAGDSVIFCYDLMNEPIITKPGIHEHPWLTGELGMFHFVQRISNRPGERNKRDIAEAWVKLLVEAIREHDKETLTTVGVIPWSFIWPKAKPIFYTPRNMRQLDFVSIHVYPKPNRLKKELDALAVYELGKPLVIGEIFPLDCSVADLDKFVNAATEHVDGWIAHYFGYTVAEHRDGRTPIEPLIANDLIADFLEYWSKRAAEQ